MGSTQVVTYRLDDGTATQFEIDPPPGFVPAANAGQIIANIRDAVGPAVEAAKVVLNRVRPLASDEVEVRFGVKVSGKESWSVAKTVSDGNFEVTLSWRPQA